MPPNSAMLVLLLSTACIQSIQAQFQCTQAGYFSMPESCQEYYDCRAHRGKLYPIPSSCPEGQLFDDIRARCMPENLLTSPPQCVKAPEVTKDITGAFNKNQDGHGNPSGTSGSFGVSSFTGIEPTHGSRVPIATGTNFCDDMKSIENYVATATGSPLVKDASAYGRENQAILSEYNTDLKRAKDNAFLWTKGESITTGLTTTLYKANEYKDEFQRKLDINRAQIQGLSDRSADEKRIKRLENEIESLRKGIAEAEQNLKVSDVPEVLEYFKGVITSKNAEIERKLKSIKSSTKEGAALQEMVNFIGFVKGDASEVTNLSKKWQEQLGSFLASLRSDANAFSKHSRETTQSISALAQERESLQGSQTDDDLRLQQLESRKEALDREADSLDNETFAINDKIFHLLNVIEKKNDAYDNSRRRYCMPGGKISEFINRHSTAQQIAAACEHVLSMFNIYRDTKAEEAAIEQLRAKSEAIRQQSSGKLAEIESITKELGKLSGSLSPFTQRMDEIGLELDNLERHASDLKGLSQGVNEAMTAIQKIREVPRQVQSTFEPLSTSFQSMIDQANAADNDADRLTRRTLIEEELAKIKRSLVTLALPKINDCH